jgi:hypothetical protein
MAAQSKASEQNRGSGQATGESAKPNETKARTTLDDDITMPSKVEPGDGPYDTTDPTEIATSVSPDKAAAARAGFGVVNAVLPLETVPGFVRPDDRAKLNGDDTGDGGGRSETYDVVGPDGKLVTVTHDLETGETTRG